MNYDSLNSETFGEASAGDWRAGHDAYVRSSSSGPDSTDDEALSDGLTRQLKGLWPSSPSSSQSSLPNIWSSPELPHRPTQHGEVIGSPSIPVGRRVLTVEELEQHVSPREAPLRPPPGIRMPQLPPHPLMGHNQPMGMPPPFMMIRGLPPQRYPMYMRPPPPMFHHPPHRVLLPPASFHHRPLPPQQQYRWSPHQHSDVPVRRSRRSEYLGEMKSDGSGFMTQREKEWVIKIQLIQLQSSDPAREDYYYMNYIRHKQEGDTSYQSNEGLALPSVEHEERKYTPTEFTGALGKLSVSSLGAPRRRIDVGVAGGEAGLEITRKKTALIVIEKLFPQVLELEELDRKDQVAMDTRRDQLRADILTVLQLQTNSTKSELALFYQILGVRKGKRLIKRLLPLLTDEQGQWILWALLHNLPSIVKRDTTDQVLPEWTPCVSHLLSKLPLSSLNTCLHTLLEGGTTGLGKVAYTQFGAKLLHELLLKGHTQPNHLETDMETWHQLSGDLVRALTPHRAHMTSSQQPHILALLQTLDNY